MRGHDRPFSYALFRVVPNLDRGEALNVGVLVFCRPLDYLGVRVHLELNDKEVSASDFSRRHGRDSTQHHRRARARPPERATVRYRSVPAGAQELAKVAVAAARTSVRPCASQLSARHGHALCARWQTASSSRGSAPSSIPGERARTRASANIKEFIMLEHR